MQHLPPKICPRCGEEYIHTATICVECNVPLGLEAPQDEPVFELPPSEKLVELGNAEVRWIEGLAQALADSGIPSRVELPRREDDSVQSRGLGGIRCLIFVRAEDQEEASRIALEFERTQVPDLPETPGRGFDHGECPGCGASVAPDAAECSDCGLTFV